MPLPSGGFVKARQASPEEYHASSKATARSWCMSLTPARGSNGCPSGNRYECEKAGGPGQRPLALGNS